MELIDEIRNDILGRLFGANNIKPIIDMCRTLGDKELELKLIDEFTGSQTLGQHVSPERWKQLYQRLPGLIDAGVVKPLGTEDLLLCNYRPNIPIRNTIFREVIGTDKVQLRKTVVSRVRSPPNYKGVPVALTITDSVPVSFDQSSMQLIDYRRRVREIFAFDTLPNWRMNCTLYFVTTDQTNPKLTYPITPEHFQNIPFYDFIDIEFTYSRAVYRPVLQDLLELIELLFGDFLKFNFVANLIGKVLNGDPKQYIPKPLTRYVEQHTTPEEYIFVKIDKTKFRPGHRLLALFGVINSFGQLSDINKAYLLNPVTSTLKELNGTFRFDWTKGIEIDDNYPELYKRVAKIIGDNHNFIPPMMLFDVLVADNDIYIYDILHVPVDDQIWISSRGFELREPLERMTYVERYSLITTFNIPFKSLEHVRFTRDWTEIHDTIATELDIVYEFINNTSKDIYLVDTEPRVDFEIHREPMSGNYILYSTGETSDVRSNEFSTTDLGNQQLLLKPSTANHHVVPFMDPVTNHGHILPQDVVDEILSRLYPDDDEYSDYSEEEDLSADTEDILSKSDTIPSHTLISVEFTGDTIHIVNVRTQPFTKFLFPTITTFKPDRYENALITKLIGISPSINPKIAIDEDLQLFQETYNKISKNITQYILERSMLPTKYNHMTYVLDIYEELSCCPTLVHTLTRCKKIFAMNTTNSLRTYVESTQQLPEDLSITPITDNIIVKNMKLDTNFMLNIVRYDLHEVDVDHIINLFNQQVGYIRGNIDCIFLQNRTDMFSSIVDIIHFRKIAEELLSPNGKLVIEFVNGDIQPPDLEINMWHGTYDPREFPEDYPTYKQQIIFGKHGRHGQLPDYVTPEDIAKIKFYESSEDVPVNFFIDQFGTHLLLTPDLLAFFESSFKTDDYYIPIDEIHDFIIKNREYSSYPYIESNLKMITTIVLSRK